MKKILILLLFSASAVPIYHFWFGKTMSTSAAEERWGKDMFSAEVFKDATVSQRAKMAASLVKKKKDWIGKPLREIRSQLGSHDGFYFTDTIPAYLISIREGKKEESWQVVFLPDADYKIKDIIIHKNCCDL